MYFWIIILFSLVTIMSYKLSSPVNDFEVKQAPAMEATISAMVQQHNAAKKYIEANPTTYTFTKKNEVLDPDLYEQYGAYGRIQAKTGAQDTYKTVIYCLNTSAENAVIECKNRYSMNFLVTYGPFPEKWNSPEFERYLLTILGRYTIRNDGAGIVEKAEDTSTNPPVLDSDFIINSIKGKIRYIPEVFRCVDTNTSLNSDKLLMYMTQLTDNDEDVFVISNGDTCDPKLAN